MKSVGLLWLMFVGLFSFAQQNGDTTGYSEMLSTYYDYTVPLIQPEELYARLKRGDKIHLLDAREGGEYEVSALNGAVHVGFLFFSKKRVKTISKKDCVVVYCTIGARSETIGERLIKNGFQDVYNLYGGIIYWKNRGYPVFKNSEETDQVHVYSKKWGQWLIKGKAKY